ncbi:MAG TPA: HD domain-containing phosphohydrolase [Gemmatimonadaceae bacterium]|nr:HD domain-containing phosphohydrolase [Gemmatimonadaceae bacterium]
MKVTVRREGGEAGRSPTPPLRRVTPGSILAAASSAPRCLVVDDEPRLRQVLMHLMQNEGFSCREASNGAEALETLARDPVPLLLTDLRMPQMDGIELLRQVRARHPDTAVVMITAVAEVEVAVSCLAMGAMDYLTKPFHLDEVRARVSQALEKRRLILENRDYQEHLEQRVAAQAHRLEELFLASLQSLAQALEVKDPYTRGHSLRVASFSSAIARGLGLDSDVIRQVELGGQVHDIGKIGVREEVLNKPGPLTDEEYAHIMTHPIVGWQILEPLLGDNPMALSIVRSHHERFDGTGTPDRLSGQAIPLEARIAAVADSYDAMTSGRPYRGNQLTHEQAIEELRRCAGTQFDPEMVAAFIKAVDDGALPVRPRKR